MHSRSLHGEISNAGLGWPEDSNTLHWLENRGGCAAVEISAGIVRQE